jgi:L-threonylcarbamoyladenylate synthase
MAEIGQNIQIAIDELLKGNLVGIPTETVYGLAGNALDENALLKIFETKNRPAFDPLILHSYSVEAIKKYVEYIPEKLEILLKHFSPGPLTVLLPKKNTISDLATSGLSTVAFRIPNHALTLQLLEEIDLPLAAPSANPFGYISPTSADHVNKQLGDKIKYILEGGACQIGIESTIIGYENDTPIVYRLGGLAVEDIEALIGKVELLSHSTSNPKAPGMLKSHYAPRKPTFLLTPETEKLITETTAFIGFSEKNSLFREENQVLLSPTGNLNEASRNLFRFLRELDESNFEQLFIAEVPNEGLGRAINDRIKRATA